MGPSGSGKSTILRCINRLVDVTQGAILFDGHHISRADKKELRQVRKKTGMIFQHFALSPPTFDHLLNQAQPARLNFAFLNLCHKRDASEVSPIRCQCANTAIIVSFDKSPLS
ncbi:MAG: ATP-binding cassette domain-containing protein [Clostridiales bacterium]|nr:ATP-binding cassette domain-containing protein [Clostridiales bacterium]